MRVLWSGPIFDPSGYGAVSRDYVKSLLENDVDLYIKPVTYTDRDLKNLCTTPEFRELISTKLVKDYTGDYDVFVNHCTPDLGFTIPNAKVNALYSVWETTSLPENTDSICNKFDAVLTPSSWSRDAFVTSGVQKPVYVVRHIVEDLPYEELPEIKEAIKDKFVVLAIMDWHLGKGYDVLIDGINRLSGREDVIFILKANSFLYYEKLSGIVRSYIKSNKKSRFPGVIPITNFLSDSKIQGLYKIANVYSSTSRREGFSMTTAHSMIKEVPVLVPSHGGHVEFCNRNNSHMYPSIVGKVNRELVEFHRLNYLNSRWVCIKPVHYAYHLENMIKHYSTEKEKVLLGKENLLLNFNSKVIAERFKTIFNFLLMGNRPMETL